MLGLFGALPGVFTELPTLLMTSFHGLAQYLAVDARDHRIPHLQAEPAGPLAAITSRAVCTIVRVGGAGGAAATQKVTGRRGKGRKHFMSVSVHGWNARCGRARTLSGERSEPA